MRKLLALVVFACCAVAGVAIAKKAAAGRQAFQADGPPGYYVWSDDAGWHLRFTTPKKQQHTLHGVVRSQGVSDVKATRSVLASKITSTDTAVRFEFDVFEGADGFDWKTTGPCVTLELKYDKKADPSVIHVGAKSEVPSAMPFDACR